MFWKFGEMVALLAGMCQFCKENSDVNSSLELDYVRALYENETITWKT